MHFLEFSKTLDSKVQIWVFWPWVFWDLGILGYGFLAFGILVLCILALGILGLGTFFEEGGTLFSIRVS